MKINTIFHTDYFTRNDGRHYVKVSVVLEGRGAFCTMIDKDTYVLKTQEYLADESKRIHRFVGKSVNGLYTNGAFTGRWNDIDEQTRNNIKCAVDEIIPPLFRYSHMDNAITKDEVLALLSYVHYLKKYIDDNCISFDDVEKASIIEIKPPDENNDSDNDKNDDKSEVKSTHDARHSSKMAFIIDNTDLNEFVNGCYYPIVKSISYDGKNYIVVKNDNGEERTIDEKRANIINVYDEAPQE